MNNLSLEVRNLKKVFPVPASKGSFTALDLPELAINGGESVAIIGPSGSGKTTLFHIIAGLLTPTEGEVVLNGTVTSLTEKNRDRFRAENIGYVFQSFNLLPAFNALENVLLSMDLAKQVSRSERNRVAMNLLAKLGLGDRIKYRPGQLSTGEQQRVAVARAVANSTRVILADEPTANVDPDTREFVISYLLEQAQTEQRIVIVATHDHTLLPRFDKVVNLDKSRVS